jgi:hypothetical protein
MDEHIIRIIDKLRYDTTTANRVCSYQSSQYSSDFRYEETGLFQTSQGRFFWPASADQDRDGRYHMGTRQRATAA